MDSLRDESVDNNTDLELSKVTSNPIFWTTSRLQQLPPDDSQSESKHGHSSEAEIPHDDELNPKIEQYNEEIEYLLCCSGYFVGFGNFITFPYLMFKNGGIAFLLPYTIAVIIVVIPSWVLETVWGQLIKSRLNQKYCMINPKLWGIGGAMALITALMVPYYVMFFPWSLQYLLYSFKSPLPWQKEASQEKGFSWNPEYFHHSVLEESEGIESEMRFIPRLWILLVVSYAMVYMTVRNGLQSTSQIVYFTVPVPCFLMAILLIRGITLEGSEIGFLTLFKPDFNKLVDVKIWEAAFTQAIYQVGLGYGPIVLYGTARKQESKPISTCIKLPFVDYFLSILSSLSIYAFLGHISAKSGVPMQDLSTGGIDLAFVAYPGLMTTLTMSNFWSVMFFTMMLMIGIDSLFGMVDYLSAYLWDVMPNLRKKMKRPYFVLLVIMGLCTISTIFTTNNGWWIFGLFSKNVGSWSALCIIIVETYTLTIYFGFEKLDALMHFKTGEIIPKWMKIGIKYVSLPLMCIVVLSSLYKEFRTTRSPLWTQFLARFLSFSPLLLMASGLAFPSKSPTVEALVKHQFGHSIADLVALYNKETGKVNEAQQEAKETKDEG